MRAGLVKLEGRRFDYQWSSYPLYAAASGRPEWFESRRVLGELDLTDTMAGRKHYAGRMRQRAVEESSAGARIEEKDERRFPPREKAAHQMTNSRYPDDPDREAALTLL